MAPLDQAQLRKWLEDRDDAERAAAEKENEAREVDGLGPRTDPSRAGRQNAYKAFLNRVRQGNLPELDDVDQVLAEFPNASGAGGMRLGQDEAKDELRKKITELMGLL